MVMGWTGAYQPATSDGPVGNGQAYVVFGDDSQSAATLELSALDGSNGFMLVGEHDASFAGYTVASAGDVNGDGLNDLLIGAYGYDGSASTDAGKTYLLYGTSTGFGAVVQLGGLDGSNGIVFEGISGEQSGVSVAGIGDVNNDGYDDIAIGADLDGAGAAYILFGSADMQSLKLDDIVSSPAPQSMRQYRSPSLQQQDTGLVITDEYGQALEQLTQALAGFQSASTLNASDVAATAQGGLHDKQDFFCVANV